MTIVKSTLTLRQLADLSPGERERMLRIGWCSELNRRVFVEI
jgi:hypothetical protein